MKAKMKCSITTGGGSEIDGGEWMFSLTPKLMVFTIIDNDWPQLPYTRIAVNREPEIVDGEFRHTGFGNTVINHADETYTAYPQQCGTPYYFEPIAK